MTFEITGVNFNIQKFLFGLTQRPMGKRPWMMWFDICQSPGISKNCCVNLEVDFRYCQVRLRKKQSMVVVSGGGCCSAWRG